MENTGNRILDMLQENGFIDEDANEILDEEFLIESEESEEEDDDEIIEEEVVDINPEEMPEACTEEVANILGIVESVVAQYSDDGELV